MEQTDWLIERFEASRTHLRAVAYRMLGSYNEADDAVQETWLRLDRADSSGVENLDGWLTTIVARVCLDRLRSRRSRREEPLGAQLPELLDGPIDDLDPAHQALMADSIGPALLVVLDLLGPAERVAFVLHDIFAVPFDEISQIVGRSPDSEKSSTPSSPLPAPATSTRCWRCSIRACSSAPTTPPCGWARRGRSTVRWPWPARSRDELELRNPPSSMAPPASSGHRAVSPRSCSTSRSRT